MGMMWSVVRSSRAPQVSQNGDSLRAFFDNLFQRAVLAWAWCVLRLGWSSSWWSGQRERSDGSPHVRQGLLVIGGAVLLGVEVVEVFVQGEQEVGVPFAGFEGEAAESALGAVTEATFLLATERSGAEIGWHVSG